MSIVVVFGRVRRTAHLVLIAAFLSASLSGYAGTSVILSWGASPSPGVSGYKLYQGGASRHYGTVVDVGQTMRQGVSGLVSDAVYYFAVSAYDTNGLESVLSSELVFTNSPNNPPVISTLLDVVTTPGAPAGPLLFTIGDAETAASNLTVYAESSDPVLMPTNQIVFGGSESDRTVTLTPVTDRTGVAQITISVSDGVDASSTAFYLVVQPTGGRPGGDTNQPAVTMQPKGSGKIQTSAVRPMVAGRKYTATAVPDPGHVFGGWTGDLSASTKLINFTATKGMVLEANFYPVTVAVNGRGQITPNLAKAKGLVAGKRYTITAIPGVDQVFSGWSGSFDSMAPKLVFTLGTNTVLQANFIPNPFLPVKGIYQGLFFETAKLEQTSAGLYTIQVTRRGTYSGALWIGANRYPLSGSLDLDLNGQKQIARRGASALRLAFQISSGGGAPRLSGTLSDGDWVAALAGERAAASALAGKSIPQGKYTLRFPGVSGSEVLPGGDGLATAKVAASGTITISAILADGTKFTKAAWLSESGLWPLYSSLYQGGGSVLSWLRFGGEREVISGEASWIKPAKPKEQYYRGGFTNRLAIAGWRYQAPGVAKPVLNLASATISFENGNLESSFANLIAIGPKGGVTNLGTNGLSLAFTRPDGMFTGKVVQPDTGRRFTFYGIVSQPLDAGFGFLLGVDQTSRVTLAPE